MTALDDLRTAVRRLADEDLRSGSHADHRYTHAPAECRYCREWTLAVIDVALLAENVLYPLRPVAEELRRTR